MEKLLSSSRKLQAASCKKLQAGKAENKLQAGITIPTGAGKNRLHRFLAPGKLQHSAHKLESWNLPQAGISSEPRAEAPASWKSQTFDFYKISGII